MFVVGTISYFIDKYFHPESANPADFQKAGGLLRAVHAHRFHRLDHRLYSGTAAARAQATTSWLLGHVWLQRFAYRQLFSLVLVKTLKRAIDGRSFSWDKLERTATVKQPLPVPSKQEVG